MSEVQEIIVQKVEEIVRGLIGNGKNEHIWSKENAQHLKMIARDLIGLEEKIQRAKAKKEKKKCLEARNRLLDHLALLAIMEMKISDLKMQKALRKKIINLLIGALKTVLVALISK